MKKACRLERTLLMPRFVVQKHYASHLHFDFRLEMNGVLKSWAVPKGLSAVPKDKRLAVQVDDHPLDYADFEGEIAEGEYGAGRVEIWDSGEFEITEMREGLIRFRLCGRKLHGPWKLIRTKIKPGNNWLLQASPGAHITEALK